MENSAASVDLSLMTLIMHADVVVKGVMLLLAVFSVMSWTIIFQKWTALKLARFRMQRFERRYHNAEYLEKFYENERARQDNPLSEMFGVAMYEYNKALRQPQEATTAAPQSEATRERMTVAVERVKERALDRMEHKLGFLATVASSAPFIGLFGTVWGIVHSFQSIAEAKNTTLAVVAPGIAEALLATGIGLFAAIPAAIFYNVFSGAIRRIHNKMNVFAAEVPVILSQR
ncbi:MAG: protein TolQ [Rickettsiales bacterium]